MQVFKIAKKNLKFTQNSMKAKYDKKSMECKFSPGNKVFALLPIPGRPLQARCFRQYVNCRQKGNDDSIY